MGFEVQAGLGVGQGWEALHWGAEAHAQSTGRKPGHSPQDGL